jgi:hypothetical protein
MTIALAVLTVSGVSWILAREAIFDGLRDALEGRWISTLVRCPYCCAPWVTVMVGLVLRVPFVWWIPIVWLSYHSLSLYDRLRGA